MFRNFKKKCSLFQNFVHKFKNCLKFNFFFPFSNLCSHFQNVFGIFKLSSVSKFCSPNLKNVHNFKRCSKFSKNVHSFVQSLKFKNLLKLLKNCQIFKHYSCFKILFTISKKCPNIPESVRIWRFHLFLYINIAHCSHIIYSTTGWRRTFKLERSRVRIHATYGHSFFRFIHR